MGDGDVGRVRAVADAGPLIHLGEIGALSLLSAVDDLVVPETVIQELEEGGLPEGLTGLEYETRSVEETSARFGNLDAGERAALELATRAGDEYVFLTDDLAARETATEEGLRFMDPSVSSCLRTDEVSSSTPVRCPTCGNFTRRRVCSSRLPWWNEG